MSTIIILYKTCVTYMYMLFSRYVVKFHSHVSLQRSVSVTGQTKETATPSVRTKHADPVHNNNQENA